MASHDAPLQELPGLQPDCMGHHEHSLLSLVLGTGDNSVSLLPLILALMSAMIDVCAQGFCFLQCLCSLRYSDIPLPPLYDTDIHRPDKLPAELASC